MIYTIEEIKMKTKPIFEKYGVKEAYLFGSYARGEATEQSDIDIAVENEGTRVIDDFVDFYSEINECFDVEVDVLTIRIIGKPMFTGDDYFCKKFKREFEMEKVSLL